MRRTHSIRRWFALMLATLLLSFGASALAKGKKDKGDEASQKEEEAWEVANPPGDWQSIAIDTTDKWEIEYRRVMDEVRRKRGLV